MDALPGIFDLGQSVKGNQYIYKMKTEEMNYNEDSLKQLLGQVSTIDNAYKIVKQNTGEDFNLFQILGMETAEVKTHSKFLAELLNPNGSHLQGDTFLKLFIEYLNNVQFIEEKENISSLKGNQIELNSENAKVQVEKYIGKKTETDGGRIDITIEDNGKNLICIENKIYAGEQDKQMLRYATFGEKYPKCHLFFLTLWGNETTTNEDKKVYSISYKTHIIEWLELCKKEAVNLPILRETIGQYINLIRKLTHQTTNKNMEKEIQNLILKNIEEAKIISDNYAKAQLSLFSKIFESVLSEVEPFIKENNWTVCEVKNAENEKSNGEFYFKPIFYRGTDWKMGIAGFNPFVGHIEFKQKIQIGIWGFKAKQDYFLKFLSNNHNLKLGWWNDYILISDFGEFESKLTNPILIKHLMNKGTDDFVNHIVTEFKEYFKTHKDNFEEMVNDIQGR